MRNPHKGHQEPGTRVGGVRIKAWRLLGLRVAWCATWRHQDASSVRRAGRVVCSGARVGTENPFVWSPGTHARTRRCARVDWRGPRVDSEPCVRGTVCGVRAAWTPRVVRSLSAHAPRLASPRVRCVLGDSLRVFPGPCVCFPFVGIRGVGRQVVCSCVECSSPVCTPSERRVVFGASRLLSPRVWSSGRACGFLACWLQAVGLRWCAFGSGAPIGASRAAAVWIGHTRGVRAGALRACGVRPGGLSSLVVHTRAFVRSRSFASCGHGSVRFRAWAVRPSGMRARCCLLEWRAHAQRSSWRRQCTPAAEAGVWIWPMQNHLQGSNRRPPAPQSVTLTTRPWKLVSLSDVHRALQFPCAGVWTVVPTISLRQCASYSRGAQRGAREVAAKVGAEGGAHAESPRVVCTKNPHA